MADAARPNILFILTDQQSAGMMSCAGNPCLRTPAMDRLAAEGVRFHRAYCTNPVCVPSRFSLVTGLMPSAVGLISNNMAHLPTVPPEITTAGLGHLLREAGYETAYGGKAHLPRMTPEKIGFEPICRDERDGLADACVEFLRRPHDAPFFLFASFINPHDICYMAIRDSRQTDDERRLIERGRMECAELDAALRRPDGVTEQEFLARCCPPLPPNFEPAEDEPEAVRILVEHRPFRLKARREWSEERWREHRWAYARLTERVDSQIGRVLSALCDSGQDERTLVVFTSDHGDMDAAHRLEHKSTFYEEACRIPLIVRPPGVRRAARVEARLVSNGLDLLPTFCEYAGAPVPAAAGGRSLRPLIEGRSVPWRAWVPVETAICRGVVTDRFKYARYDVGTRAEQLTDLMADPHEMRNHLDEWEGRSELENLRNYYREAFGPAGEAPRDVVGVLKQA